MAKAIAFLSASVPQREGVQKSMLFFIFEMLVLDGAEWHPHALVSLLLGDRDPFTHLLGLRMGPRISGLGGKETK